MAGAMIASDIVTAVIGKLGLRISEEFALLRRFKVDLEDLRSTLTALQAVLRDAEERCAKDEALRGWLKKLKDAAYDVDDLLDEFDTDSAQRKKVKMVCRFFSPSNPLIFGRTMVHKMKSLRERLDKIAEEKDKFRLTASYRGFEIERRDTFSMVDESKTVGRDDDKETIMNLLLDTTTEEDVSVIPIVGMGGLGKTTLAQLVFNDSRANSEIFETRIWICVSADFSLKTIVQPILDATKEKCDINNLESIASCLARVFTERRYFLVLDDCWNENQDEWEKLKLLLKDGKRGSKIIVTTRSTKAAKIMKTVEPFYLKGLSDDDCWELFKRKAFEKGEEEKYPNLVKTGREIVKKCGGVPLAANALGSLMRFKRTDDAWLAVKHSEIWKLEQEDTILPSLRLSYTQMPSPLKQCFAYCSIFPKHYEIDKEKLIRQWIALGFIQSRDGQSWPLEDKGNEYFNHLLWMSFLQEVEEVGTFGRTKYRMHHLVHDLAQSVAGDEVVMLEERTTGISEACRYASLTGYKGRPEIPNVVLKKVRALHLRHSPLYAEPLRSTKNLRALDLHGNKMKEPPNSIKKMKLLRYLDISSTRAETLPRSMSNLHNLQCLYLSECSYLQMLPKFIGRLNNLQVLDLTACKFQTLPKSIGWLQNLQTLNLSLCPYLKSLPESLGNLGSLQTLNLEGCYYLSMLPDSICSLENLQSLNLSQCCLERLPDSLGRLSNLLELNLSACSHLQALPESIGSIGRLQTLNLSHCSDIERLPKSIGRLQNLQVLNLSQYIDIRILPESMSNLVNLQDLNLSWNIILETLPESVSSLQNLRTLNLFQCWGLQQLPESITNLMKLEMLNLVGCENLTELPDSLSNMTNLRHLRNDKCWSLRGMPRGIGRLTNLQTLPLFIMNEKGGSRYSSIAELKHLNLLSGDLRIECPIKAKNLVADAQKAQLKEKKNLRSLTLSWKGCHSEEVDALLESFLPPQSLLVLNIDGYMGTKFSSWMTNKIESRLPNLVHLTLSNIHICDCLPPLGQLPALQSLELRYMSGLRYMDTESYVSGCRLTPFPSLKELHFENIPDLEEWPTAVTVDNGGRRREVFMFTSLKTLTASGCPKLKPKPCLPASIVDLWVCNNSEMLSLRWQMGPSSSASSFSLLRRLWIKNCGISSDGWKELQYHTRLEDLTIESCDELISLPESMQHLISLRSLKILACTNLAKLPEWLGDLTSLETLEISDCSNLTTLPQSLECLTALKELIISCCNPLLRMDGLNISHDPNIFIG